MVKSGMPVGSPALKAAMISKMEEDLKNAASEYLKVYVQVHIMFKRYLDRRTENIDRDITVVAVEHELRYRIPGTDIDLMGILDLAYEWKNKLVIRDHKTGENRSAHSDSKMETQDQTFFYATLWWKITGRMPDIMEVSWINSKTDYANGATNEQLFGRYRLDLTEEMLTGFWNYLMDYVKMMQSGQPIRRFTTQCERCRFKDPCLMSMQGRDPQPILDGLFKVVPRDYEFTKFTEISSKQSNPDITVEDGYIVIG